MATRSTKKLNGQKREESIKALSGWMGEEYLDSFPGQMFKCLAGVAENSTTGKLKALGRAVNNLIPFALRDRIGYDPSPSLNAPSARFAKVEPWRDLPQFKEAEIERIAATIAWLSPNKYGRELVKLWRSNPEKFSWYILDVYKLLSAILQMSGGWS